MQYIHTKLLSLDIIEFRKSCELLNNHLIQNYKRYLSRNPAHCTPDGETPDSKNSSTYLDPMPQTSKIFNCHNVFQFSYPQFYELYKEINTMFQEINPTTEPYYIQCWINYTKKDQYLDWHSHWPEEYKAWSGYYCAYAGDSKTSFRIPNEKEEVDVISKDNLLVLAPSAGDTHRTHPWNDPINPRITLAFDIFPRHSVPKDWIDLVVPL